MKNSDPVPIRQVWVLCFILGVVMLNFPFIQIFNRDSLVFGFPILFLYLIVGWPASIFVIYLFTRQLGGGDKTEAPDDTKEQG